MKKDQLVLVIFILVALVLAVVGYYWYSNKTVKEINGGVDGEDTVDIRDLRPSEKGYTDVSPEQSVEIIEDTDNLLIVDVSPHYDDGHLLNSVNYYLGDEALDQALSEGKFDEDRTYLVYCHVDSASVAGAEKLVNAGMKNVYRLDGNYSAWLEAGYPIIESIYKESGVDTANLSASARGGEGRGVAYVLRSEEDGLKHMVKAELPNDLQAGEFYEGWLVSESGSVDFFSTGKMTLLPEGDWLLEYISEKKYNEFNYVVITKEKTDDGEPETHVIEGRF
ncbi:MAG: hypothetical protein GF349_03645 [Candidatus Magasanikbacteria bacterium]|nr:hypothetical protein [Candidatus Magasanikbacteria bacterium]